MIDLQSAAKLSILAFVTINMLSVGLGLSLSIIILPLRSARWVLSVLVASFVFVPLLAIFIVKTIALDQSATITILLLGTGAGAPILPKLIEFARGNVALAAGVMILLMAFTVIYMPVVLPLLIPGAELSPWLVAKPLVTMMLAPLIAGLMVKARMPKVALAVHPFMRYLSTFALFTSLALVFTANYRQSLQLVNFNLLLAITLLLVISLPIGYLLGGRSADHRLVLAFGAAQRDLSAAALVASDNLSDLRIVIVLTVAALVGACLQIPLATLIGRRARRSVQIRAVGPTT